MMEELQSSYFWWTKFSYVPLMSFINSNIIALQDYWSSIRDPLYNKKTIDNSIYLTNNIVW